MVTGDGAGTVNDAMLHKMVDLYILVDATLITGRSTVPALCFRMKWSRYNSKILVTSVYSARSPVMHVG